MTDTRIGDWEIDDDTSVNGDAHVDWADIPVDESAPMTGAQFIDTPAVSQPDPAGAEPEYDYPDPQFVKAARRRPHAAAYQSKVHTVLHMGMQYTLSNHATVPDGAALIQYGPAFEHAMGDWAAEDKRVAKAIDFIAGGTTTPAMAAVMAAIPLVLQVIRNHEPEAEVSKKSLKIWRWTLPIKVKFRIKLKRLRPMTNDPEAFTNHVLGNAKIREMLEKQGILVDIKT